MSDISELMQAWIEEAKESEPRGIADFRKIFTKAGLYPAVVVVKGQEGRAYVPFLISEYGSFSAARDAAAKYLRERGVDPVFDEPGTSWGEINIRNTALVLRMEVNFLNVDTSHYKDHGKIRSRIYIKKNIVVQEGNNRFPIDPNWTLVSECVFGEEPTVKFDQLSRMLWMYIVQKDDATYKHSEPETHNDYNSEEYINSEGETVRRAKRFLVVEKVFSSKEEMLKFMEAEGVEVVNTAQGAVSVSDIPVNADWLAELGLAESAWESTVEGAITYIKGELRDVPVFPAEVRKKAEERIRRELSNPPDEVWKLLVEIADNPNTPEF